MPLPWPHLDRKNPLDQSLDSNLGHTSAHSSRCNLDTNLFQWFGFYYPGDNSTIYTLQESELYLEVCTTLWTLMPHIQFTKMTQTSKSKFQWKLSHVDPETDSQQLRSILYFRTNWDFVPWMKLESYIFWWQRVDTWIFQRIGSRRSLSEASCNRGIIVEGHFSKFSFSFLLKNIICCIHSDWHCLKFSEVVCSTKIDFVHQSFCKMKNSTIQKHTSQNILTNDK